MTSYARRIRPLMGREVRIMWTFRDRGTPRIVRYNGEVTGAFSAGREAFIVLDHGEVAVPTSRIVSVVATRAKDELEIRKNVHEITSALAQQVYDAGVAGEPLTDELIRPFDEWLEHSFVLGQESKSSKISAHLGKLLRGEEVGSVPQSPVASSAEAASDSGTGSDSSGDPPGDPSGDAPTDGPESTTPIE